MIAAVRDGCHGPPGRGESSWPRRDSRDGPVLLGSADNPSGILSGQANNDGLDVVAKWSPAFRGRRVGPMPAQDPPGYTMHAQPKRAGGRFAAPTPFPRPLSGCETAAGGQPLSQAGIPGAPWRRHRLPDVGSGVARTARGGRRASPETLLPRGARPNPSKPVPSPPRSDKHPPGQGVSGGPWRVLSVLSL